MYIGLRCRHEQDVVNHDLILECNGLDLLGHREHHMEVVRVEQFRPTVIKPLSACETLALRAAFVTAGVVPDALMTAIAAPLDDDVLPESRDCGLRYAP